MNLKAEWLTSLNNPKIKNILLLEKNKERKNQNTFIIEGWRELNIAIASNYSFHTLFICPELFEKKYPISIIDKTIDEKCKIYFITDKIFEKIAYRENSDGVIALGTSRHIKLNEIKLRQNPFIIILESVEKPGNLGAILRTADAAQVDAVIICDPKTDLYNPNTIRSSIGCIFSNQVVCATAEETLKWLNENNIKSYAAALPSKQYYHHSNFKEPSAIVMGTEATGLTEFWLKNCNYKIQIPMLGAIDSLNVSTATAILTFEAMRQRNFNLT